MIAAKPRRVTVWLRVVLVAILLTFAISAARILMTRGSQAPDSLEAPSGPNCKGAAACLFATVTYIVDGDTLDVGNVRIRLAMVNTPELGQPGYAVAKHFTAQTCPVGTRALVDEDDAQTGGSYGRMVAVVYCMSVNLNAALLRSGDAVLVTYYCSKSEFAKEAWTGCD